MCAQETKSRLVRERERDNAAMGSEGGPRLDTVGRGKGEGGSECGGFTERHARQVATIVRTSETDASRPDTHHSDRREKAVRLCLGVSFIRACPQRMALGGGGGRRGKR